jgi:ATP-binding cassette subfamily F protein 3
MLKVNELSYSFPQKDLYEKVSFELTEGQHCAFIGSSGIGKSSMIDIIMDPENHMFDGSLEIDPLCRIGFVSQFSQLDKTSDLTVFQYIGEIHLDFQSRVESICTAMETSPDIEALLEEYQEALDSYEAIGGDAFESIIDKKLYLANLQSLRDKPVSELSGGEFKLIQVIKEMLCKPNLLIMDEPDAFLDYENLNSLKNLINSHKGILLVITHNRYLLSHCFNKILHLENKKIQEFEGNFTDYSLELLKSKIETQELASIDDAEIERNKVIIGKLRFEANQNADAAKGRSVNARVKLLERLKARRIKSPFIALKQPHIKFSTSRVMEDRIILKVNDYNAAFEEVILENVSFHINSGDKVALIGSNGAGKTTLLKEIYRNSHDAIDLDEEATVEYLSQLQGEILNEENTISEEFFNAGFKSYDEIKHCVSNYGFDEGVINQRIRALSGGEKNMLQLAKISASNADFLLLDEPTSHLDIYSQLALEKAFKEYTGTVLMISHDYQTIVNSMDYILIIEDKSIRRMSVRKFRKMIYDAYFDKDYLEFEQKKKSIETRIELALKDNDFEEAKRLSGELEQLIDS